MTIKKTSEKGKKAKAALQALHTEAYQRWGNRCLICRKPACSIHELIPRSHGKKAYDLSNMIPVCLDHHEEAHREGTKKFRETYSAQLLRGRGLEYEKVSSKI